MMKQPWLSTCVLMSNDANSRMWDIDSDRVSVRLMVCATDATDFEDTVRRSVGRAGIVLEEIGSPHLASSRYVDRAPSPAMREAMDAVDALNPIMVSIPVPAAPQGELRYSDLGWSDIQPERSLWALVDGVTWPGLPQMLSGDGQDAVCLYTSTDPKSLAAAPWLVRLDRAELFFKDLKARKPEQHSGILFRSPLTLRGLRRHFRRFTMLATPIGGEVPQYFRFYDPRVFLDALSALDANVRKQLLQPLRGLVVPLSPNCLLPPQADLENPPTVFTPPSECADRLLRVSWGPKAIMDVKPTKLAIDAPSFERFGHLKRMRSINALAKSLFDEHSATSTQSDCLDAARLAPVAARQFKMESKKQVTAIATGILRYGPEFWTRYDAANRILQNMERLPWQRKNDLNAWFDSIQTHAAGRVAS